MIINTTEKNRRMELINIFNSVLTYCAGWEAKALRSDAAAICVSNGHTSCVIRNASGRDRFTIHIWRNLVPDKISDWPYGPDDILMYGVLSEWVLIEDWRHLEAFLKIGCHHDFIKGDVSLRDLYSIWR